MSLNKNLFLPLLLIICAFSIIGVLYFKVLKNSFAKPNAVLSVISSYEQASVILDGALVGKTPYESGTLKPGEHTISLKSDTGNYETKITLVPQAKTVISREVGAGGAFSSGYAVWMEKISGGDDAVSIISNPSEAVVTIDKEEKGKTPVSLTGIAEGNHTIEISKVGYEPQSMYLKFKKGFKLNVVSALFLLPLPSSLEGITYSDKVKIYNLALSDSLATVDSSIWAKAAAYFVKTREKSVTFNYFVDPAGILYDAGGIKTTLTPDSVPAENTVIGYLAKNKGDLSVEAKQALEVFGAAKPKEVAKIFPTGVGWLRVRSEPSLNGSEVAKVNVGEEFAILDEKEGWIKIKVNNTTEGWVSAAYVQKSAQ